MQALENWIRGFGNDVNSVINVTIGAIAAVVISVLVLKAIWAFRGGQTDAVVKNLLYAAAVVLIAIMGAAGLKMLVEMVAPDSNILPRASAEMTHAVASSQTLSRLFMG